LTRTENVVFETVILHVKLAMLAFGRTLIYVVEIEMLTQSQR